MTDGLTPDESARIDELVETLFAMAKQAGESIRENRGATEPRVRRAPDITHLLKADLRAKLVEQVKSSSSVTRDYGTWLTTDCMDCDAKRREQQSGIEAFASRMILCPKCGDKRCPKAASHRNDCNKKQ